jgi:hypothetical protein
MPATAEIRFSGTLTAARGGGAAIEVDADVRAAFGEARPPVKATINGVEYRSRLMVYGGVRYLGLTKAIRSAAGIGIGDEVDVVLRRDDAPREVELPLELERALNDAGDARHHFDALAFTHRREYAQWIGEAKRPETRERRATRAIEMLREGVRHP